MWGKEGLLPKTRKILRSWLADPEFRTSHAKTLFTRDARMAAGLRLEPETTHTLMRCCRDT